MYGVQKSSKAAINHPKPLHSNKLSLNSNSGLFDSNCVKLATPTYAGMSSSSTIYDNSSISTKNNNNNNNNTRPSSISNEK